MKDPASALAAVFEVLDKHPFRLPHAERVVHDEEGCTWGLTATGAFAWGMPTEVYEALLAYGTIPKPHRIEGNMKKQEPFDPKVRAAEKQASREKDARDLATGVKTREQLWRENTMLPAHVTTIDISKIPIPD